MFALARFRAWIEAVGTLFHPPHCAGCESPVTALEWHCAKCRAKIERHRLKAPLCATCSEPFEGAIDGTFQCPNCSDRRYRFVCASSAFRSRDLVREAIHQFKYNGHLHLRHPLGEWLADALADERMRSPGIDALVPVPLHPRRRRERGFNQADLLAHLAGKRLQLPVEALLRRTRYTTTQTRFHRQERIENLRGAFSLTRRAEPKGRHLVLVDDVFTTGATVDECALVLRKAGAASVRVATVARG